VVLSTTKASRVATKATTEKNDNKNVNNRKRVTRNYVPNFEMTWLPSGTRNNSLTKPIEA